MAKKSNNISWLLVFSIFILIVSFTAFLIALNLNDIVTLQKSEIPVIVIVSNHSAYNISKNQTDLNLGTVKIGTAGMRNLSLNNDYSFKTIFEFEIIGDISPLMIFQPVVIFEPNENKNLVFKTKIIENESFGEYSGTLFVRVKKFVE